MDTSSDSDDVIPNTPPELLETAQEVVDNLLPEKSKCRYNSTYENFIRWQKEKKTTSFSENVLLSYFSEKAI